MKEDVTSNPFYNTDHYDHDLGEKDPEYDMEESVNEAAKPKFISANQLADEMKKAKKGTKFWAIFKDGKKMEIKSAQDIMNVKSGSRSKGVKWGMTMESVNEASKKSVTAIATALAKVADEMKKHAGYYTKAKEKGDAKEMKAHIGHLKQLTAQKKELEKGLDTAVSDLDRDAEMVANEQVLRSQIRNMVREQLKGNK